MKKDRLKGQYLISIPTLQQQENTKSVSLVLKRTVHLGRYPLNWTKSDCRTSHPDLFTARTDKNVNYSDQ